MNKEQIEQIVNAVRKMAEAGNSYATIGQKLGKISKATVSAILNGKHEDISQKMWESLYGYLGFKKGYVIVRTSIFKQIETALSSQNQRIKGIALPTGNGKTTSVKHYCRNSSAIYIQVDPLMRRGDVIREIAETLNVSGKSVREKFKNVVTFMQANATHLILDEFSTAKTEIWEEVFSIVKHTENSCSFTLVGTGAMRSFVEKKAMTTGGFSEIHRRLAQNWVDIEFENYKSDVLAILDANGIKDKDLRKVALQLPNFGEVGDFIKNLNSETE